MIDPAQEFLAFIGAGTQGTTGSTPGTKGIENTNTDAANQADGALSAFAEQVAADPALLSAKAPEVAAALQQTFAASKDPALLAPLHDVAPFVVSEGSEAAELTIDPAALEALANSVDGNGGVSALSGLLAGAFTPIDAPLPSAPAGPAALPAAVLSALQGALPTFNSADAANTKIASIAELRAGDASVTASQSFSVGTETASDPLLGSLANAFNRDTAATSVFLAGAPQSPGALETATLPQQAAARLAPENSASFELAGLEPKSAPLVSPLAGTQSAPSAPPTHILSPDAYLNRGEPLSTPVIKDSAQNQTPSQQITDQASGPATVSTDIKSAIEQPATSAPTSSTVSPTAGPIAPTQAQPQVQVPIPAQTQPEVPLAADQLPEPTPVDPQVDPRDEKPKAPAANAQASSQQTQSEMASTKAAAGTTAAASSAAQPASIAANQTDPDINPIGFAMAAQGLQQKPLENRITANQSGDPLNGSSPRLASDGSAMAAPASQSGAKDQMLNRDSSQDGKGFATAQDSTTAQPQSTASDSKIPVFEPAPSSRITRNITLEGFTGFNPNLYSPVDIDGSFMQPIMEGVAFSSAASSSQPALSTAAAATAASNQVGVAITKHAKAGQNSFELRLDPAELGRVSVTLTFASGKASADIVAERPETLQLLQRDQKALETALEEAGHDVEKGGISFNLEHHDGESAGRARSEDARAAQKDAHNNGVTDQNFSDTGEASSHDQPAMTDAATLAALVGGRMPLSGLDIRV